MHSQAVAVDNTGRFQIKPLIDSPGNSAPPVGAPGSGPTAPSTTSRRPSAPLWITFKPLGEKVQPTTKLSEATPTPQPIIARLDACTRNSQPRDFCDRSGC